MRIVRSISALLLVALLMHCTDAGLYSQSGSGPGLPDRANFEGVACVPLASGSAFPVKVLFAVQGGDGTPPEVVGAMAEALDSIASRFSVPFISFGLSAFHTVATGLQSKFVDAATFQGVIPRYATYQEVGPVSLRAPLRFASSLLSGDMQTSCRGTVARTRYLVVMVVSASDTSCANPDFNAGLDATCTQLVPTQGQGACSRCELTRVTDELKALGAQYGAGEVTVQPIYVRSTIDPLVADQVAAIARSGGTAPIQTDPGSLKDALNGLNYASLQRSLKIRRVLAFNRNSISRAGQLLVDSDEDGLPDTEESSDKSVRPLNPLVADTDADGLMDGVERRMGLDPVNANPLTGCNPLSDEDGDRLNDCEERALGTNACVGDTDGDSVPDLVEAFDGLNPLVPEDLADSDGDGISNIAEAQGHTDPFSSDAAYFNDRGYAYSVADADPTEDGRPCYRIRVDNVGMVETLARPNAPFADIPKGMNDVYLYVQFGREGDPRGAGIGSLHLEQIQFTPPATRTPSGTIPLQPDQFVVGQ